MVGRMDDFRLGTIRVEASVEEALEVARRRTNPLARLARPAHRRAIERAEAWIHAESGGEREAMVALSRRGKMLFQKVGTWQEVTFTADELARLIGQVDTVIHNHNDDSAFWEDDYAFAAVVRPAELIVAGVTGRWRLIRVKDNWPPAAEVLRALRREDRHVRRQLFEEQRAGRYIGNPFSWVDRSGHVWRRLQGQHPEWFIVVREDYAT
jgi:hypothetical protein